MNSKQRTEKALEELSKGHFIIVCDDDQREDEGDLVAAAQFVDAEMVNFAISEARGLLCQPIDEATACALALPMMSTDNNSLHTTAFTVSVDHRDAGTGISAAARALTIRSIAEVAGTAKQENAKGPKDLKDPEGLSTPKNAAETQAALLRPGHIFPLLALPGGVLQRPGHTEATIDLLNIAGLQPSGILCELVSSDGTMARGPELEVFAAKHKLCKISVQDIISYRREVLGQTWSEADSTEARFDAVRPECETEIELPSELGEFRSCMIQDARDIAKEHLLIWKGSLAQKSLESQAAAPLLRIHSECFTGEVLFSQRCDCREQLNRALQEVNRENSGMVIYLRQEGRGIGLRNKLRAYQLQQQQKLDTVDANIALGFANDLRDYDVAIGILRYLGIEKVRLMTNNPKKITALEQANIAVERIPIIVESNPHSQNYLDTKKHKSGHLL